MATVLLVEDNEDVREMMSLALQLDGNRVLTAGNGREALAVLRSNPAPSVILLDLMMPGMDGWELCAAIRQDPRLSRVPIVVVSAMPEERARRLEAAQYLPKPVDLERLVGMVCEVCADGDKRNGPRRARPF